MIELEHVYLSYTKEFYTLFDVSFSVDKGKTAIIFGPLESGKSSLLRVIGGFEKPTSGTVLINKQSPSKIDFKSSLSMAYLPSSGVFKERKTVYENLLLPLKLRKVDKHIVDAKVFNAIKGYDLTTLKNERMQSLQTFDRIKVALARFSLRPVDLFLIDDVFSMLSDEDAVTIAKYITELIKNNEATAIIACSNQSILKYLKGDVIKLEQGSITA